jgi:hypothetical protein
VRLLLENQGSTLLDIARVISDEDFRRRTLKSCRDRWTRLVRREFDSKKPKDQQDEVRSLANKAHALAYSLPLQLSLGQAVSTIDLRECLDTGKTVVCDLSGIGDEPARL